MEHDQNGPLGSLLTLTLELHELDRRGYPKYHGGTCHSDSDIIDVLLEIGSNGKLADFIMKVV
jgi:hypothetical protein